MRAPGLEKQFALANIRREASVNDRQTLEFSGRPAVGGLGST
jgi:hypothetical protein